MNSEQYDSAKAELERMEENCLYSAQAYFEAAKRAELWGRLMMFIPACTAAVSGFLSALNQSVVWSALSAVSGSVAATASFLGTTKKAADFESSARSYTSLRHKIRLELGLLSMESEWRQTQELLRTLNSAYTQIVSTDIPVPNRSFNLARKRIQRGLAS
ncbi:SLATT domain-containing protein [Streptomyces pseudogriseolus]|uniref:SLATT domain-containing protein n=1 Tax=Streptomyces TaxID=1883 RepID=UPI001E33BD22|nr:SLATT domain-containing protein [Streptomyces fungicidicus]